jgi:hypothetical protein
VSYSYWMAENSSYLSRPNCSYSLRKESIYESLRFFFLKKEKKRETETEENGKITYTKIWMDDGDVQFGVTFLFLHIDCGLRPCSGKCKITLMNQALYTGLFGQTFHTYYYYFFFSFSFVFFPLFSAVTNESVPIKN